MAIKKQKTARPKALVVFGGWDGHQPKETSEIFITWLKARGFDVTVKENMDIYTDAKAMAKFALIVPCWTMGTITGEQCQGLRKAVLNGCGLAGWHGGMCDAFRNDTGYQFMTGGQWVEHPGGGIVYAVDGIDQKNPLTKGIKKFKLKSEQYYMHVDPSNHVLAWTTFTGKFGDMPWIKGCKMPVVWTRPYGKGKVFYSALGHNADDFKVPEVLEIMKRGMQWAAGMPIKPEFKSK